MALFDVEETPTNSGQISDNANNNNIKKTKDTKEKKVKEPKIKVIEDEVEENVNVRDIKQIRCFDKIGEQILQQFKANKLHHATMFSGNYGIGKATFAYWLICQMILENCKDDEQKEAQLDMLQRNVHPDVLFLQSKNGGDIMVDEVRILLDRVSMKSTYGNKFILIDDINSVNVNGVNALLKTLEEPTPNTFFFIINQNTTALLDTIYSRCNEIKLSISRKDCIKILTEKYNDYTSNEIDFYTDLSDNSIALADILIDNHILTLTEKVNISNIKKVLNDVYKLLAQNKEIGKNFVIILLEKIMLFLIKDLEKNTAKEELQKAISLSNSIIKQFLNFKRFDLPIRFV